MADVTEARNRLVEAGGKISQDLGMGRIVGQILLLLYLNPEEVSLDAMEEDLGLSKASVSIAARQLESFGLIRRVWKKGDRRSYYRTTENIGTALQQGVMTFLRQKLLIFGSELEYAQKLLEEEGNNDHGEQVEFCQRRVQRALQLQKRFEGFISNPIINILTSRHSDTKEDPDN